MFRVRCLRPIDLARAAGISTQQVRRYEALGAIPAAVRSSTGYRQYTQAHLDALVTLRSLTAGFGVPSGVRALQHVMTGRPERAFAIADRAHLELHETRHRILETIAALDTVADSADTRPRTT